MSSNLVYAPGPRDDSFVELSKVGSTRLFKKMILRRGSQFVSPANPNRTIKVDDALISSLEKNFREQVCPIVQVPVCDDKNRHTEDPLRNVGQVIDLRSDEKGLYAYIDARKAEAAEEFGKTLIGASAMMHMNYADTHTGERKGPTLLHVAVTNRPYLADLDGFEEVIAASHADHDDEDGPVLLSEVEAIDLEGEEQDMKLTKEQLLAALKDEHGIDVAALTAGQPEVPVALSNALGIEAGDGAITLEDIAAGVVELSNTVKEQGEFIAAMTRENDDLRLSAAEQEIDTLISEGRILPKQREDMVALSMANREMFDRLLPENPIVSLSETGVQTHDERNTGDAGAVIDNYVGMAQDLTKGKSRR